MTSERHHWVTVGPLPSWMDHVRLLGEADWREDAGTYEAQLPRSQAADLAARLRGQGYGGQPVTVQVRPKLARNVVRAARLEDAKRRRDTSPGFTRRGVKLDDEGKRSLTPEVVANALAARARSMLGPEATVLDATCGVGGNAIAFARAGLRVVAVELSPERARLAAHNAHVYGVSDRIEVRQGDAREVVGATPADLLWIDPPWGDWDRKGCGLEDLPLLADILATAGETYAHTWCKVPPSFDARTTPGFDARAWFGEASGDRQRVKLVCLTRG